MPDGNQGPPSVSSCVTAGAAEREVVAPGARARVGKNTHFGESPGGLFSVKTLKSYYFHHSALVFSMWHGENVAHDSEVVIGPADGVFDADLEPWVEVSGDDDELRELFIRWYHVLDSPIAGERLGIIGSKGLRLVLLLLINERIKLALNRRQGDKKQEAHQKHEPQPTTNFRVFHFSSKGSMNVVINRLTLPGAI